MVPQISVATNSEVKVAEEPTQIRQTPSPSHKSPESNSFHASKTSLKMASNSTSKTDDETGVDVIRVIQERNAYKQETEKLWKIIEKQRYIIKSLQSQISRKQSSSTINTPSLRSSNLTPELTEGLSDPSLKISRNEDGTRDIGGVVGADRSMISNALGLDSLSISASSTPQTRNSTHPSHTSSIVTSETGELMELNSSTTNLRPWAKSTRLSEIYADYSNRRESSNNKNASIPSIPLDADGAFSNEASPSPAQAGVSQFNIAIPLSDNSSQRNQMRVNGSAMEYACGAETEYSSNTHQTLSSHESSGSATSRLDYGSPSALAIPGLPHGLLSREDEGSVASLSIRTSSASVVSNNLSKPGHYHQNVNQRSLGPLTENIVHNGHGRQGNNNEPTIRNQQRPFQTVKASNETDSSTLFDHLVLRPISTIESFEGSSAGDKDNPNRVSGIESVLSSNAPDLSGYEYMDTMPQDTNKQPQSIPQNTFNAYDGEQCIGRSVSESDTEPFHTQTGNPSSYNGGMERQSQDWNNLNIGPRSDPQSSTIPPSVPMETNESPFLNETGLIENPPLRSLEGINIEINDSLVKIDDRGKEVNVYLINVIRMANQSSISLREVLADNSANGDIIWSVEKRYSDFLNLNGKLRHAIHVSRRSIKLERLPDKDIFRANAPVKNDKRKLWFERYLKKALTLTMIDQSCIMEFLSTNIVTRPEMAMPILLGHKEGFLVKKGKNFGGWKRRYYVCKTNRPILEYFDGPGGSVIGSINLRGAVVKTGKTDKDIPSSSRGKSNKKESDMFRHAFLIEEPPKRSGKDPISHPLWADSDRERDEWVTALRYVIVRDADGPEVAMKEVERYASKMKASNEGLSMLNQIKSSITHEQTVRQSLEYSRMREESGNVAFALNEPIHNSNSPYKYAVASPTQNMQINKIAPQDAYPWSSVTASLDRLTQNKLDSISIASGRHVQEGGPTDTKAPEQPKRSNPRPRSLSFPPINRYSQNQSSFVEVPKVDMMTPNRPSPVGMPKTFSSSLSDYRVGSDGYESNFSGDQRPESNSFSDNATPSAASCSISNLGSFVNEYDNKAGMGQHIRKDQCQYQDQGTIQGVSGPVPNISEPSIISSSLDNSSLPIQKPDTVSSSTGHLPNPTPVPASQAMNSDIINKLSTSTDPSTQMLQPVSRRPRTPFTKDSVGRIVREDDFIPDLPEDTPHVTNDILGVGRASSKGVTIKEASNDGSGTFSSIFGGGGNNNSRTREEKKRGRITFIWGKRKQEALLQQQHQGQQGHQFLGDKPHAEVLSITNAPDTSLSLTPRRFRRGSVNDNQNAISGPFKHKIPMMPVFGVPLELAVQVTKVREHYELPAVVYRCIEYLDSKKAWLEEGIYRQSGSFSALDLLRKSFNTCRDFNLLKQSPPPDIHAVASLLKAYLRELPQSVLTPMLHQEFVKVIDLAERQDRVHELGRLVSTLPIANYTLLRALTAHLIRIVKRADVNKMTLRNIGIVFSPSLGVPVGVFSLFMIEFEYIFWVNDRGRPEPRSVAVKQSQASAPTPNEVSIPDNNALTSSNTSLSVSVPRTIHPADSINDSSLNENPNYSSSNLSDKNSILSPGLNSSMAQLSTTENSSRHLPRPSITSLKGSGNVAASPDVMNSHNESFLHGSSKSPEKSYRLEPQANAMPRVGNTRQDGTSVRGLDTLSMAAVTGTPWYPHQNMDQTEDETYDRFQKEFTELNTPNRLEQTNPNGTLAHKGANDGRNNRNSMQYAAGAPYELILQESGIDESSSIADIDDDSTFEDPMMRLSRHASWQTLKSKNTNI